MRALTDRERRLLNAMLDVAEASDAPALRQQLDVAQARSGCRCGCGSIDIVLPDNLTARSPREGVGVLVEGDVVDDQRLGGQPETDHPFVLSVVDDDSSKRLRA